MYSYDGLGTVKHTWAHYIAHIIINDTLIEALVDTCGAKSMIDRATAEALGLEIEVATKDKHFGSFFGPGTNGSGNRNVYYYGRIKGPIDITFGKRLLVIAEELKVVEHFEPLILIGTDILTDSSSPIKFCYVGLHPEDRNGVIVFKDEKKSLLEIPLASWPLEGNINRAPALQ